MPALDPALDDAWQQRLAASPRDASLREGYLAALEGAGDPRAELLRVEAQVDARPLDDPGRPALKRRRDALRAAAAPDWRRRLDLGRAPGCRAPLPWPEDTATRWLALCEYIEEVRGVPLPAAVWSAFADEGTMVGSWGRLLDAVREGNGYWSLFRDAISSGDVRGWSRLHSLMVQGEGDFHWAVDEAQRDDQDPPVHGLTLDYDTNRFEPAPPLRDSNCTCYGRVTDFIRGMFETYDQLGSHDRFVGGEPLAPSTLHTRFAAPAAPRPTCDDLGTARLRDADEEDEEDGFSRLGSVSDAERAALAAQIEAAARPGAPGRALAVRDARGRLRDDLDADALLAAVREADPDLVDGPSNKVLVL